MKVIIDTHTFLWFIEGDSRLSATAKQIITEEENTVFLSIASIWEIAIKVSLGKLTTPPTSLPFVRQIDNILWENSISLLPITLEHLDKITKLPFHHRDPFDRLLIAQSIVEDLPLVSVDQIVDAYGANRIW